MSNIKLILGQVLQSRNMSANELSRITGIRYETVTNLVRGKVERVSLPHLARIMDALELDDIADVLVFEPDQLEDPLDDTIELLDLPPGPFNRLRETRSIKTIRDVLAYDLSRVPGLGPKQREIVERALDRYRS